MILLVETHAPWFSAKTPLSYVGYNNKNGNTEDSAMKRLMCANFIQIGEKDAGMYLSQLKYTGYQGMAYYTSRETIGGFSVNILSASGKITDTYTWTDDYDSESETWSGGYWYHEETEKAIGEDDEPDLFLGAGKAVWCYLPRTRNQTDALQLVSAGQVLIDSQAVPVNKENSAMKCGIGNLMAVPCYLSQVSFTGYEGMEYYISRETIGGFSVNLLSKSGKIENTYTWTDDYNPSAEEWTGGYWYHEETEKAIGQDDEPDVELLPGDAHWVYAPRTRDQTEGIYLVFPKTEISK